MNPGTSPLKSSPIDQLRRQLESTLSSSSEVRAPRTPPNSPRAPRDGVDGVRRDAPAPRPVAKSAVSSGSSLLGLQMAELGAKNKIPDAPPAPPPMPAASSRARRAPATPAAQMGAPEHAGKSPADLMKLFAARAAHGVIDLMASADYGAIFDALASDAPLNLKDVLHQMVAVERLGANAGPIAAGITRGIPQGEMAAGRFAGYQVHPHDYAGDGDATAKAARLTEQFARDATAIKDAFAAADAGGDRTPFYRAFTPKGDAACHAVRMNGVYRALEDLHRTVDDPFDGTRADTSPEVLQAAYQLAVEAGAATEANLRGALGARGLAAGRIDTIVAQLQAAMMLDD